ncbi:MAG: hypothetical protein ABH827_06425 [bacterium]
MTIYGRIVSIFFLTVLALIVSCPFNNFVFAYQPQERVFDKLLVLAKNQADLQNKKILKVQQQVPVQGAVPSSGQVALKGGQQGQVQASQPDSEKPDTEIGEQVQE